MNILYNGPHIQVLERRGSSSYALVTFNERGFQANGTSIWGQAIVDKLDLNAIGFVTKAPNWFPLDDLARACAAAQTSLAPFAERIGYGFSQGGYAAIKASRPLALIHTIAVSPQWSIDPDDIADPRFNSYFVADLHRRMRIVAEDAPAALHLLYDAGLRADRAHVDQILAEIPDARRYNVPFTGHDTIRVFVGRANFERLVRSIVSGSPERTISRLRRDSIIRKATMIERTLRGGRLDRAFALIEATPLAGGRRSLILAQFVQAGAADRILPRIRKDADARPDDPLCKAVLAFALAKTGEVDAARRHIAEIGTQNLHSRVQRIIEDAEHALV